MRPQILNPARLASLFRAELELCHVAPGETIALLTDLAARREYVAAAFAAADELGAQVLFSTGPNTQGGGTRATQGHYDVPMRDCTVMLDGEVIVKRGRIVDKRMLVQRVPR